MFGSLRVSKILSSGLDNNIKKSVYDLKIIYIAE